MSRIISEAIAVTGPFGMINIEPFVKEQSEVVILEGGIIAKGCSELQFMQQDINSSKLENPLVLITDVELDDLKSIVNILSYAEKVKRSLVIICPTMSEDCMRQILFNVQKQIVKCAVLEMKSPGDWYLNHLTDLAILFDAQKVSLDNKALLSDSKLISTVFGEAKSFDIGLLDTSFQTKENKSAAHRNRIDHQISILFGISISANGLLTGKRNLRIATRI